MTRTRYLSVTLSSASFDADEHFLIPETPAALAAIWLYAQRAEETGDGHASFDVAYLPADAHRGPAAARAGEQALLSFVVANCSDDGKGAEILATLRNVAALNPDPVVCVRASHAGEPDDFLCVLRPGRDADEHAEAVLAAWLAHSGRKAGLEPDEDDSEDWSVAAVHVFDTQVCVTAERYRGDGVALLFNPPKA